MNFIPPQDEGRLRAAASGVLPNGKAVLVNADGTVSVPASSGGPAGGGTPVQFSGGNSTSMDVVYDSNADRVVVAYRDDADSGKGKAIVGTVSGSSISFGTAVEFLGSSMYTPSLVFDSSANKVILFYDSGNVGKARVGTVSGTSISFGTEAQFSSDASLMSASYDANTNKTLVAFRDFSSGNQGKAVVATVSGTNISFGSAATFESGTLHTASKPIATAYDPDSQKIIIAFSLNNDNASLRYGKVRMATISGTSVSFGTAVTFNDNTDSNGVSVVYDTNVNRVVVGYINNGNSGYPTSIVGTVSGTDISFGTAVVVLTAAAGDTTLAFDATLNKVVYSYSADSQKLFTTLGTVSGTSISFSAAVTTSTDNSTVLMSTFDPDTGNTVIVRKTSTGGSRGQVVIYTNSGPISLTSENYIGMSGGDVVPENVGSPVNFESGSTSYVANTYDSNADRVVVAYSDAGDSGKGKVAVGTVSGDSTSFGTPVAFTNYQMQETRVVFDSNSNKIVIAWIKSSDNAGLAIVGTVDPSDNSISFGSEVQYESVLGHMSLGFDSTNNKVISAFADVSDNNHGYAIVGTVSGTSISFGSIAKFEAENTRHTDIAHDPDTGKTVIAYVDQGNSSYGTAVVSTVSGTSISFGTPVVYESASVENNSVVYDTNSNKMVIAYGDIGNSQNGTAIVGTVSGTSISFGTPVVFDTTGYILQPICTFDAGSNKVVITFSQNNQGNDGRYIVGTVSGTSISFSSSNLIGTGTRFSDQAFWIANVGSNKNSIVYRANLNNDVGRAVVLTLEQRGQVASGSSASIDIIGTVSENQTGLTAGQSYFVQTDGTIGLTADDPSVFAGTAISATELLVKT